MRRALLVLWLLAPAACAAVDLEFLDRAERALTVQSKDGFFRAGLSGLLDLETYVPDQYAPGLIFGGDDPFGNPRLSLFLDASAGRHLYGLVQARFDRGFDPRERPNGSARIDEYLLRWSPFDEKRLNLQIGKFPTVVGNFVARHDSWQNPFVTAPLPYENVTIVSDNAAPGSAAVFLARRNVHDKKRLWLPIVWGPDYAAGLSVFGRLGRLEYAAEVKNAALASRPAEWDPIHRGWGRPTGSGRLGIHPTAAWTAGVSFSSGPYLRDFARDTLPRGTSLGDVRESVIAGDASWAWHHLQLWAEFFAARFDVPRAGHADTAAYYVESRYKLTPELSAALRWNQQFFGDVQDEPWDRGAWRLDTALGYRFDRHLQAKLQYAYMHQQGRLQQGEQLVAAQLTLRF